MCGPLPPTFRKNRLVPCLGLTLNITCQSDPCPDRETNPGRFFLIRTHLATDCLAGFEVFKGIVVPFHKILQKLRIELRGAPPVKVDVRRTWHSETWRSRRCGPRGEAWSNSSRRLPCALVHLHWLQVILVSRNSKRPPYTQKSKTEQTFKGFSDPYRSKCDSKTHSSEEIPAPKRSILGVVSGTSTPALNNFRTPQQNILHLDSFLATQGAVY